MGKFYCEKNRIAILKLLIELNLLLNKEYSKWSINEKQWIIQKSCKINWKFWKLNY